MPFQFFSMFLTILICFSAAIGCHGSRTKTPPALAENVPGIEAQEEPGESQLPEAPLPPHIPGENSIKISENSIIPVRFSKGKPLIPVEGMIADSGFARIQANASLLQLNPVEKTQEIEKFFGRVVEKVNSSASIHDLFVAAEVGYFSGWVSLNDYPQLRNINGLPVDISISPRLQSTQRPHNISNPPVSVPLANPSFAHFSGLDRMGVTAFLKAVRAELGEEPTGRRVAVGVTDSGVTYGHPAFRRNQDGKSRVTYMKDFTNEGAGFIFSQSKFSAQRMEAPTRGRAGSMIAVSVTAEYVEPDVIDKLARGDLASLPLAVLNDEIFLLPEKLVQIIEMQNTTAKLGVISESSYASRDEKIDLNGNGKNDDLFYFFYIPAVDKKSATVWIDFSGTGNFKSSKPMSDFNLSGDVTDVMSERVGLAFSESEIPGSDAKSSPLKLERISIVGFDPGNHGSHVAGIIGAGRTLSNDAEGTLARGVSPEVSLMVNRVCSNNGGCDATKAIIDLAQNGAKIINMSLGGLTSENDGYGIQESVINRLTDLYDVLFVISAGNSGPGRQTVASPSTARHALSVAATSTPNMILRQYNWIGRGAGGIGDSENGDDDFVMYFSSRGPSAAGGFKPNISAPGSQLSVIQLNAALGFRAGSDVYWGTSMAAPAAAGAAALLLDAALAFNEKNPSHRLPTDALTLRRVLLDSARPFNVSLYRPGTGEIKKGVYTWIDQGYGMVSLPDAWDLLKRKAAVQLTSGVELKSKQSTSSSLALDYQVRVLRPMGNGKKYDGSQSLKTGTNFGEEKSERKFGQGIWLTEKESDKLVEVQFSRRLPLQALARPDVGELLRQLNTSSETFELETIYYGSNKAWLKIGVPQSLSCDADSTPENNFLTLIGGAALETPVEMSAGALNPLRASSLFLCLNRKILMQLAPGDHGAMIRAYRVNGNQRDPVAAFEVPVYLTVPHHSVSLQAKFSLEKQINSFSVERHYVRVPEGVNVFRVTLEVPEQLSEADAECSGVSLMILKGSNTAVPGDLAGPWGVAQNCNSTGAPTVKNRVVKFSELNPAAGIWDVHVLGRFQFPLSRYKLEMDYAVFGDLAPLNLTPETISSGEFQLVVRESTFDAKPEVSKSSARIHALIGRTQHKISANDGLTIIPSAGGLLARTYDETAVVIISTTSIVSGLDIDMVIDECDEAALKNCKQVANSGNASAEERAVFMAIPGKFYAVKIDPYEVPQELSLFSSTEEINVRHPEFGALSVLSKDDLTSSYYIQYSFDSSKSVLLQNELFKSGKYELLGDCQLANASGSALVTLPIHVLLK